MRKKQPVPFAQKFPNADPLALRLLEKLLAFDPKDRPTAEEVCFIVLYCLMCAFKCSIVVYLYPLLLELVFSIWTGKGIMNHNSE